MQHILEAIGAFVLTHLANIGRIALLYGETMRQVTRRLRVRSIVYQMAHLGADSLLIVGLTLLFTGIVLTLQSWAPSSSVSSAQGAWVQRLRRRSRR